MAAPKEEKAPRKAPVFETVRELGAGAVGRVELASLRDAFESWPAGTQLAVKCLHAHLKDDANARRSFGREAEVGALVRHPSLVRHLFAGERDGLPFLVMEHVPGRTLRQALDEDGELPEPLVRNVAAGLAAALAALHAAGFVHADVKLENARLDARGRVVLMDLGFAQRCAQAPTRARRTTARATAQGVDDDEPAALPAPELAHAEGINPGSLAYLAPERARGLPCTPASDVFSLGIVLYELCTRRHPFADSTRDAAEIGASGFSSAHWLKRSLQAPGADLLLAALATARFVPPSRIVPQLSPFLDTSLQDLLRRTPAQRPSAHEVASRFEQGESGAWWRSQLDFDASARRGKFDEGEDSHLTPLVGREHEMAELLALYERATHVDVAARAACSVVWLLGPSGSGKSRLMSDCATQARHGEQPPLYLYGRCTSFEEQRPCAPILRLVERYLRLPSGAAPTAHEERQLARIVPPRTAATLMQALDPRFRGTADVAVPVALAEWMVALAREMAVLYFLDDVNFADEGTLDVLTRVADDLARMRALLVLGYRDHEPVANEGALERLRERLLARGEVHELRLAALSEEAVQGLVTQLFHHTAPRRRLGQVLWQRSRGNPGLLAEILRSSIERGDARAAGDGDPKLVLLITPERLPLPESLQTMIQDRFDKLLPRDRDWVQRLSVVGGRLEHVFLLRAFPDANEAELDELLARLVHGGWLVSIGDRYRFARPALREAVYRSLDPESRRRLHSQAAEAFVQRDDAHKQTAKKPSRKRATMPLADALQRAFHLRAAERHADLLRILRPLIERLPRRGQPQRVHTLARWGLEALDALRVTRQRNRWRIEFLEAATDAADRLGLRGEQRESLDHLSDMDFDPTRDGDALARVYLLHGRYAVSTGQYGLARGMLRNAVELAEKSEAMEVLSEALRRLSAVQAHVGELVEARELGTRALDVAVHDPQRAVAWLQLGVVDLLENNLEAALRDADRALAMQRHAKSWNLPGILAAGHMLRGRIYRVLGRPARALGSMQRAVTLAKQAGERRLEMEATARFGGLLLDLDQPDDAEARLREALLIANEIEDRRGQTLAGLWLGTLLWEQASPEAAQLLGRVSRLANEMGLARAEALALAIRARIAREAGEIETALELSDRAHDLIEHQGAELPDRIVVTGTRALVLHTAERGDEALPLVKELRQRMRKENARLKDERLQHSHRNATTRLLEAVLSPVGVIYPRVEAAAPAAD